ncbi:MAG TPA: sugar phosphate isomerase/epimerase family protein [Symbiobacteriaceae bacterium]|nr:sugar phosphate isomerase/epimerase family protein [Symbiobacteriaceae bacterium]
MLGLSSTQLWGYASLEVLELAARLGYTGVELWVEQFWAHGDDSKAVHERARELGLHLTVHSASWDLNLTARNAGIRQASTREVIRSIELAAAVGADMITVHPGRSTLHEKELEWHWERQVEAFRFLAGEGDRHGVRVNVEMMEQIPKEFCTTPAAINRLLDAVDHFNLGVTYDVAHTPLDQDPLAFLLGLKRVDEVHLSDSTAARYHVPLGKGQIQFGPVLAEVARRGLPVTIEGYEARRTTELAAWNKQMLDKLWQQAVGAAGSAKCG